MQSVFIAGPIKIKNIDENIQSTVQTIIRNNLNILIGDANGLDKGIQQYLADQHYSNVTVYCINKPRNNLGGWAVKAVTVSEDKLSFDEYIKKDKQMADKTDFGFMIWNGISNGTLNNILNLIEQNKKLKMYFTPEKKIITIRSIRDLEKVLDLCKKGDLEKIDRKIHLFERMKNIAQGSLFNQESIASVREEEQIYRGNDFF